MCAARRRWFRFSLRALFILIAVIAVWLGWNLNRVRQREEMVTWIRAMSGTVLYGSPHRPWQKVPLSWKLLGADSVSYIKLGGNAYNPDDLRRAQLLFPEAEISYGTRDP